MLKKVKDFYKKLSQVQPREGKDIGLICLGDYDLSEIVSSIPESNKTALFELNKETVSAELIKEIADLFEHKKKTILILRLHDYLSPKIYNQLYLISRSRKMDFSYLEEDVYTKISSDTQIILVTTEEELENLNYDNLLNLVGPVLRL